MSHGKLNELIGSSNSSFEDALAGILERANKTLRGVRAIDVISKQVTISNDQFIYTVRGYLRFDMTAPDQLHW